MVRGRRGASGLTVTVSAGRERSAAAGPAPTLPRSMAEGSAQGMPFNGSPAQPTAQVRIFQVLNSKPGPTSPELS